MVLDKLFGWIKKKDEDPPISFGRYSDNNKSAQKVERWAEADNFFKEKEYAKSMDAFFDYLCDEEQDNVRVERKDGEISFVFYQGSKVARGEISHGQVRAEIAVARMPEPSIPVMRRLLEMNFNLYYSRFSMKDDLICMQFNTPLSAATPNKMYYGLKELATKADKQDDLLLNEFGFLLPVDSGHVQELPQAEKEIKYAFLQEWIGSTLGYVETLDAEKFSGGISYLLLTLVFRIDYLISPEGKILNELEKVASIYYSKDDKSYPERNPSMIAALKKIQEKSREEIFNQFFRSKYTFAIVVPHSLKSVSEAIETALQNMLWYRDNSYPELANKVMEYGFAYSQYSYSLPRPLSELFRLFMQINYNKYFAALGFTQQYYNDEKNAFNEDEITDRIGAIVDYWKHKYASLHFKTKKLKFDTLLNFNHSFLQEVSELNFD
jgi:hypothetical protein